MKKKNHLNTLEVIPLTSHPEYTDDVEEISTHAFRGNAEAR